LPPSEGVVSFAVVDTAGRLRCYECYRRYVSASVVKVMILVAYLRGLAVAGKPLSSYHRAVLDPMIRESDNDAATSPSGASEGVPLSTGSPERRG
jgi:hypothetical protein